MFTQPHWSEECVTLSCRTPLKGIASERTDRALTKMQTKYASMKSLQMNACHCCKYTQPRPDGKQRGLRSVDGARSNRGKWKIQIAQGSLGKKWFQVSRAQKPSLNSHADLAPVATVWHVQSAASSLELTEIPRGKGKWRSDLSYSVACWYSHETGKKKKRKSRISCVPVSCQPREMQNALLMWRFLLLSMCLSIWVNSRRHFRFVASLCLAKCVFKFRGVAACWMLYITVSNTDARTIKVKIATSSQDFGYSEYTSYRLIAWSWCLGFRWLNKYHTSGRSIEPSIRCTV